MVTHYFSLSINNEFSKVPRDMLGLFLLLIKELRVISQVFVYLMGIGSIDFNLGKQRKLDIVFRNEFLDIFMSTRFLIHELVARKSKNFETLTGVFFMQLHHLGVVLICQSSL